MGFLAGVAVTLAGLLGLFLIKRMAMRRRYGCGHHGGRRGRSAWMHDGPRGDGFVRAWSEVFKRRMDIDEDQGDIVDHAWSDGRKAVREFVDAMSAMREPFASLLRAETLDEAEVAVLFRQQDEAIHRARRALWSSIKQVHAVLSPEQRAKVAAMLARDGVRWV